MAESLEARVRREVARLRRRVGVSQAELDERLGATAARRLARRGEMTLSDVARIASALGADVDLTLTSKRTPRARPTGRSDLGAMTNLLRVAVGRLHDPLERYAAGEIIAAVKGAPQKYGEGAVTVLARAVGEDEPSLYRFALVAETFSRSESKRLLAAGLTWSHLVALSRLGSPRVREMWTERALKSQLSVRELQNRLARG